MKTDVTKVGLETSTVDAIGLMQRLRVGCLSECVMAVAERSW